MRTADLTDASKRFLKEHPESLVLIEGANDPVFALRRIYGAEHRIPLHSHSRTQIWCAREGVVVVSTAEGRWLIPPGHGLIIPAGLNHSAQTINRVEMQSIYIDQDALITDRPRVVEITALATCLITEVVDEDSQVTTDQRKMLVRGLLLDEINRLPDRPLGLPFPGDPRLAALCRDFLKMPAARSEIDDWAMRLGISRRSFTRLFRAETGVSFATWRQQACLFAALPRLTAGDAVTTVAMDVGYESIAAFTTMFRRMLGSSPRQYLKGSISSSADDRQPHGSI
ncbi:AraC family transcriptional regulator [Agrobacterium vitis]|uniref:AraC family transcriptional regulator n=1 Tax=Agrobacterium vitis TaxID=373 RepID=UPI001574A513|nr:helix-turn-helix transcriptional regulator [Agrobacterium vitis]NSZ19909.1 AraC family transcriptional regulator [Agrobacterium vitis]QZO07601.1 helix-turn-helix transcriptional regulator [Agrobacterium vitis]UJL90796.1 helix-turn-helix transcriptional regulator [Agrobacterium vitis]